MTATLRDEIDALTAERARAERDRQELTSFRA